MAHDPKTPRDPRRAVRRPVPPAPARAQRAPLSRAEREEQQRVALLATRDASLSRRPRHTLVYDGATNAVVAANGATNDFDDEQVYNALADEDAFEDADEENVTPNTTFVDGDLYEDEDGDVVYSSSAFTRPAARRAPAARPAQRSITPQFELDDAADDEDDAADDADIDEQMADEDDDEAAYAVVVPDRVDRGDEPPLPPTGMPVQLSDWINVGKYDRQFDGWYIKCYQSVSLGVMRQAEALSDEVRQAERRSRQSGKQIKPRIRVEVVQNLLCDLVADFNYVDPQRRPLPKPPYGLSMIRGDLLMATFAAATDSLNPSKTNARRSTRR